MKRKKTTRRGRRVKTSTDEVVTEVVAEEVVADASTEDVKEETAE